MLGNWLGEDEGLAEGLELTEGLADGDAEYEGDMLGLGDRLRLGLWDSEEDMLAEGLARANDELSDGLSAGDGESE